jgi:short-subunit dehydrogenase
VSQEGQEETEMGMEAMPFAERYGPWAVVAGASEGVGEGFARAVAQRGINVVVLARRQAVLDEVAASIRGESGVEVRPVAIDLATDDAMGAVVDATKDLEVGLIMYCAGADPNYTYFLDQPVETAKAMVHRNCVVPLEMCHHFAPPMRERGKGGIILVGSGAGLIGAPYMVAYGATKAFDMVFAESLWAELHGDGVDVLGLVLALTDTPAVRRLLVRRGQLSSPDDPTPLEGAVSVEDTVADALEQLANGPTWFVGDMLRDGAQQLGSVSRSDAVKVMIELGDATMGPEATPVDAP